MNEEKGTITSAHIRAGDSEYVKRAAKLGQVVDPWKNLVPKKWIVTCINTNI